MWPFSSPISIAVVTYVGFGHQSFPSTDVTALVRRFGDKRAAKLLPRVEALLRESLGVPGLMAIDLAAGARAVQRVMRKRHWSLSRKALRALAWYASFNVR